MGPAPQDKADVPSSCNEIRSSSASPLAVWGGPARRVGGCVCVDLLVIGHGHVGLQLARGAAFSGLRVLGFDVNADLVACLSSCRSHVGDIPHADIAGMPPRDFCATATEADEIGRAHV